MKNTLFTTFVAVLASFAFTSVSLAQHCSSSYISKNVAQYSSYVAPVQQNYVAPVQQNYNYQQDYAYPVVAVPLVSVPVHKTEIKVQVPVISAPVVVSSPAVAYYSNPVAAFQLYALQNYNYNVGNYGYSTSNYSLNLGNQYPHASKNDGPRTSPNNVRVVQRSQIVYHNGQAFQVIRNQHNQVFQVRQLNVRQRNVQFKQQNFHQQNFRQQNFHQQNFNQGDNLFIRQTERRGLFGGLRSRTTEIQQNGSNLRLPFLRLR